MRSRAVAMEISRRKKSRPPIKATIPATNSRATGTEVSNPPGGPLHDAGFTPRSGQAPDVKHAARGVTVRVPLRERDPPVHHNGAIPVAAPAREVRELRPGV